MHRRAVRMRQDDVAAPSGRTAAADQRRDCLPGAPREWTLALARHRISGLSQCVAALAHRRRQRRAQPRSLRHRSRATRGGRRRIACQDGLAERRRPVSEPALRRNAAAGPDRALPGTAAEDHADGRALRRARRDHAAVAAGRDARHRQRTAHDRGVHHPRSRGSDLSRRSSHRARRQSRTHR